MNENGQNAIIIVLLIFIALKVYKEDIEKLGDIIGKIIASIIIVIFKGLWKIITFPFQLILTPIATTRKMWIAFSKWIDKIIHKF